MLYCWFRAVVLYFTYASTLDEWYAYEQYDAATRLMCQEPQDYVPLVNTDNFEVIKAAIPTGVWRAAEMSPAWKANFTQRVQNTFPEVMKINFAWGASLTADLYATALMMDFAETLYGGEGWWRKFVFTAYCWCKQYRRNCNPMWVKGLCERDDKLPTFDDMRDAMGKGTVAYHPDNGHAIFPGRSR